MDSTFYDALSPASQYARSDQPFPPASSDADDAGTGYYTSTSCLTRAFTPRWLDASLSDSPKVVYFCLYEFGAKVDSSSLTECASSAPLSRMRALWPFLSLFSLFLSLSPSLLLSLSLSESMCCSCSSVPPSLGLYSARALTCAAAPL